MSAFRVNVARCRALLFGEPAPTPEVGEVRKALHHYMMAMHDVTDVARQKLVPTIVGVNMFEKLNV